MAKGYRGQTNFGSQFAKYLPLIADNLSRGIQRRKEEEEAAQQAADEASAAEAGRQKVQLLGGRIEKGQFGDEERIIQSQLQEGGRASLNQALSISQALAEAEAERKSKERLDFELSKLDLEEGQTPEPLNFVGLTDSERQQLKDTAKSRFDTGVGIKKQKAINILLDPTTTAKEARLVLATLDSTTQSQLEVLRPSLFKEVTKTNPKTGVVTIQDLEGNEIGSFLDLSKITKPDTEVIERDGVKITVDRYGEDGQGNPLFVETKREPVSDSGNPYKAHLEHLEGGRKKFDDLEIEIGTIGSSLDLAKKVAVDTDVFFGGEEASAEDLQDVADLTPESLFLGGGIEQTFLEDVNSAKGALEILHNGYFGDLKSVVESEIADDLLFTMTHNDRTKEPLTLQEASAKIDASVKGFTDRLGNNTSDFDGHTTKVIVEYLQRLKQYVRMKNIAASF